MKFILWLENQLISWFGNSKVVDSQGKPLRVFHGTPKPTFSKFSLSAERMTGHESGSLGIWFTNDPAVASTFATIPATIYYQPEEEGKPEKIVAAIYNDGQYKKLAAEDKEREVYYRDEEITGGVYPVYLKIERPKIYAGKDGFEDMMDDRDRFAEYIDTERYKSKPGHWRRRMIAQDSQRTNSEFINSLKNEGHDGIIIIGTKWDAVNKIPHNQYVVFDSDQIRNAIGNN